MAENKTPHKKYSELSEKERKNILTHYNFGRKYGLTQKDVCNEFNISRYSLQKVFDNSPDDNPIYSKRINPFDLNEIVNQYRAGTQISNSENWQNSIAGYHGLSESTIIKYLKSAGVYKNGNGNKQENPNTIKPEEKKQGDIIYLPGETKKEDKKPEEAKAPVKETETITPAKDLETITQDPTPENQNSNPESNKHNYFGNFKRKFVKYGVGALVGAGLFLSGLGIGLGIRGCEKKVQDNKKIEQTYVQGTSESAPERERSIEEIAIDDYHWSVNTFCDENKIPTDAFARGKIYEELTGKKYKTAKNGPENEELLKALIELRQNNPERFANVVKDISKDYLKKRAEVDANLEEKLKEYGLTQKDIRDIYNKEYGGNFCGDIEQTLKFLKVVDKYKPIKIEVAPEVIKETVPSVPITEEIAPETKIVEETKPETTLVVPPYVSPVVEEIAPETTLVVPTAPLIKTASLDEILSISCAPVARITPAPRERNLNWYLGNMFFNSMALRDASKEYDNRKSNDVKLIAEGLEEMFGGSEVIDRYELKGGNIILYDLPNNEQGERTGDIWVLTKKEDVNGIRTVTNYTFTNVPHNGFPKITEIPGINLSRITPTQFGEEIAEGGRMHRTDKNGQRGGPADFYVLDKDRDIEVSGGRNENFECSSEKNKAALIMFLELGAAGLINGGGGGGIPCTPSPPGPHPGM